MKFVLLALFLLLATVVVLAILKRRGATGGDREPWPFYAR